MAERKTSQVTMTTEEGRLILDFSQLQSVLEIWKPLSSKGKRQASFGRIQETVERLGILVEVRVQGHKLAEFGPGGQSGLLQRLMSA